MKKSIHIFSCLSLLISNQLFANDQENLFELSFEELMDVNISLATKTDETRASVPSSITVFNQQHISMLGVSNAYELMNFVPGFQSTRGDWVGAVPKEHTRGIYLDNGNVLVMINGQRLNESSFGKASVYMPVIPVELIEKVEFIRGPGSALYGSNAFLGVMNIVTKQDDNQVTISIAEQGEYQASLNAHKSFSDTQKVYANAVFKTRHGEKYGDIVRDPITAHFIEFGMHWDDFSAALRHNKTQLDEFMNLAGVSKNNFHRSENLAVQLAYEWLKDDVWQINTSVDFIRHDISSAGLIVPAQALQLSDDFMVGPAWRTENITFNFDAAYTINASSTVNFGLEYSEEEQVKAGVNSNFYDFQTQATTPAKGYYLGEVNTIVNHQPFSDLLASFDSYAAYAQVKHQVNDALTVFVGARFDEVKSIDSKLSPRVAAIYSVNPQNTFKFQYGESFRTPVGNELYSNDDVTLGNPNLTSEYVKTTEVVWHTQTDSWQIDVVVFDNQLEDFINLVPTDQAQTRFTFDNVFENSMQGVELNGNFNINDTTWFEMAYTQIFDEPFNPSFKKFAAAALTHQLNEVQLSLNAIWRDRVFVESPSEFVGDFNQSDYVLLGFTAIWQMNPANSIMLKGKNLLDKQYKVFDPRVFDGNVPMPSRQLKLQYTYTF